MAMDIKSFVAVKSLAEAQSLHPGQLELLRALTYRIIRLELGGLDQVLVTYEKVY